MGDNESKRPVMTFAEAERVNPYELARRWGDAEVFSARLKGEADADRELEELATMAALRTWLNRWIPTQINGALLGGATVDQVAGAIGVSPAEVVDLWRDWVGGQRSIADEYPAVVTPERLDEFDRVAAILARVNT